MPNVIRPILPLIGLVLLAGCDPMNRPGTWNVTHSNDANLLVMVAVPSDLVRGIADDRRSSGLDAAAAIDRERTGKVYPLPDTAVSKAGPSGASSGGSQ